MAPTCITTQLFFVLQGYFWQHLECPACDEDCLPHVHLLYSPLPLNWPRKTPHHSHAASISWEMAASLPRCSPGVSELTKQSRCPAVLPSLWFPLHFSIHCVARADGKTALLPGHLHVNLGPKATALRLWTWQSEKRVSFHSVWGSFLNRSPIYSLGLI